MVKNGPEGSKGVQNGQKHLGWRLDNFGPFWTLLDYFGALKSLPCLAIFGPKWTIFLSSPPPPTVMNIGPQCKKRLIRSPMRDLLRNTGTCYWQNLTVLSGKTPKTAFLSGKNLHHLTLGGAGGQTFGGTLENFGFITEGWECNTPMKFFWQVDKEINEKYNFFTLWPQSKNFSKGILYLINIS